VRHFVTKSDGTEEAEGKPIQMVFILCTFSKYHSLFQHNGGPKYARYGDDSPGNTSIPEFGANGQFYQ
jgi:hypothetical protein